MDCKQIAIKLQDGLKEFLGDKNAIIGISGGLDSAVVAALCVNAVGKDRVIGKQMPYGEQSIKDGNLLIHSLGIPNHVYNIKPMVDSIMYPLFSFKDNKLVNGNIRARVRMILLYAFAGGENGLVIGTGNELPKH